MKKLSVQPLRLSQSRFLSFRIFHQKIQEIRNLSHVSIIIKTQRKFTKSNYINRDCCDFFTAGSNKKTSFQSRTPARSAFYDYPMELP